MENRAAATCVDEHEPNNWYGYCIVNEGYNLSAVDLDDSVIASALGITNSTEKKKAKLL